MTPGSLDTLVTTAVYATDVGKWMISDATWLSEFIGGEGLLLSALEVQQRLPTHRESEIQLSEDGSMHSLMAVSPERSWALVRHVFLESRPWFSLVAGRVTLRTRLAAALDPARPLSDTHASSIPVAQIHA